MPTLTCLRIADAPAVWRQIGVPLAPDGSCAVGSVRVVVEPPVPGAPAGIVGWELVLDGAVPPGRRSIDGLVTDVAETASAEVGAADPGPLGLAGVDHVVVMTPDLDRTIAAVEAVGVSLRRVREHLTAGRPVRQAFFRLREVVLEVVGPPEPDAERSGDPAVFWGLAVTVRDLEAAVSWLGGERAGAVRDAVQPGRRIASVRREAGLAVPLALMSPDPRQR